MPVMLILLWPLAAIAAGTATLSAAGEATNIGVFALVLVISVLRDWSWPQQ